MSETEKKWEQIYQKYNDEGLDDIAKDVLHNWDLESKESNKGHDNGGIMGLILNFAEYLDDHHHQELAEYFKASAEDFPNEE